MKVIITFWLVVALTLIGLSLPPALRSKSWKRFIGAAILSAVGILFPVFIFTMSMFLVPEWKGGCRHGWLDCFHVGKLALLPLVLWACVAFYVAQILRPASKSRIWVDLGIFIGFIVSSICLVLGLVIHALHDETAWWLLVPLYVTIWYSALCIRAIKSSGLGPRPYVITLLGSVPFWVGSVFWSKKHYVSLPDNPPDCFVVTAALRGHETLVGPFSTVARYERVRVANRQLQTFWQFEAAWRGRFPATHRIFRHVYNRLGPCLASRIRTRLAADVVYLTIKPFEIIAAIIVGITGRRLERRTRSLSEMSEVEQRLTSGQSLLR